MMMVGGLILLNFFTFKNAEVEVSGPKGLCQDKCKPPNASLDIHTAVSHFHSHSHPHSSKP